MNTLSWNFRGLGLTTAIKEFKRLIFKCNQCIVFLCETKMVASCVNRMKRVLGFSNVLVIDACGRSGSLAMFWNDYVNIKILSYSYGHVDALMLYK